MKQLVAFRAWWGQQGRWTRRSVWALAGLVVLWAVAWAAVPPLLKWQLQKQASDVLGRAVTVERVRFSPWSLELELQGLRIAAQDAAAPPQFEAARAYVDAELQSLLRLAPVLDAVQLDAPRLRVRHLGEGRYDFDDVLQRLAQRPPSESDEPARFALYNVRLTDGAVTFDDQPVGAVHQLEQLNLAVPFLSNLGSQREVVTQPHLAFVLNGSRFDSQAETTPFAETRATEAQLVLKDFELAPYLGYWPAQLPAKPAGGRLQADLRVAFEQHGERPSVKVSGDVALERFKLLQSGADLLAWDRLAVRLADVRPLERHVGLERVDWQAPRVSLARAANGQTNIERLLAQLPKAAPAPAAASATPAPTSAPTPGWTATVGEFHLQAGRLDWNDQSLKPAFATAIEDLDLRVRDVAWPVKAPMPLTLGLRHKGGTVQAQGQATDQAAEVDVELKGLSLADAGPYIQSVLTEPLKGQVAARAQVAWRAGDDAEAGPRVRVAEFALTDLQLGAGKEPPAALRQLRVTDAEFALQARRVNLGKVLIDRPQVLASRDPQGRWMVDQWLRAPAAGAAQPEPATRAEAPASAAPEWALGWTSVELKDGSVRLDDRLTPRPARMALSQVQLTAGAWRSDAAARTPLTLDARMAGSSRSRADPGRLQVQGQLGWKPGTPQPEVSTSARVTATALPLHALEPYVSEYLNLELLRADAGYRGQVEAGWSAAGLRLAVNGDVALDEFRANTLSPSEELLAWKALNLRGLQLAMAPGQPLKLQVAETALTDWYARIAIDPTGRINLQDLVKPTPGAAATPPAGAPATAAAPAPAPAPAATAAAAPTASSGPAPDLRFGPVALVNGRVLVSDQFIKPNYRANLSELTGKLSAFSNRPAASGSVELADLELLGRVEGTASLDLRGRINPLAQPLALDVTGKVRDLELPPLSPYSAKYAGYGIERGKLSVNVAYRVTPDGQLTASNQIILNQLAFGDRVEGSDAPNLPVKLAVALLADRSGVIDINLPISGSMNDPQFSIGPVIFRAIFNLIGKAITAPFALLASALGGGGEESAQVAFAPGTARLDAEARTRLDGVAKALTDRPSLRLTVVGHSNLEAERQAYQRERLAELVRAEKRRTLTRTGAAADGDITVSAEEYPNLLRAVYRRADITKPRNVIGMAKDIPQAEMEALLMTSVSVTEDAMRELALQRGVAVREYLASRQLPTDRVFLGAPQPVGQGAAPKADGAAAPGPRADLQLATR